MSWHEQDAALRGAAFRRVRELQLVHGDSIPWSEIEKGYQLAGAKQFLASKAQGIYTPARHPAALSVKTIVPRTGRRNVYSDRLTTDGSAIRYSYKERGGPHNKANTALRQAHLLRLPIIYFAGVAPGFYSAVLPVYVVGDDEYNSEFLLAPDDPTSPATVSLAAEDPRLVPPTRRYTARQVLQRLHQKSFRHQVLHAYRHHCAMCSIHFDEFLEAAHILPDSHELGVPDVSNGLALCSLHHNAFDRFLIDVDDDYRVELSPNLRRRRDGPLFRQAFLERHGEPLHLPSNARDLPKLEFLRERRTLRPSEFWT